MSSIPGAERYSFVSSRLALEIERTEGSYMVTPEGHRILDAAGGAIVVNIGHGREEVAAVFAEAALQESYVVPPFVTPARARLTERLLDRWLPEGLTRVVYTCGGSESADAAVRLARQHHVSAGRPSRYKVIGRDLSYHGMTMASLSVGGHGKRRSGFEPLLLDLPKAPACYCYRCPVGKTYPQCEVDCARAVATLIEAEGPDTVAAFIAEPIGGSTAGGILPVDEYWPMVVETCREYGVLVIADEVMTGFGRTGKKFGVDHWGFTPDILFGGKGLTGGYAPMGAVCATEDVVAPIIAAGDEVMFYTYSGHSAGCAVADKVLEILERESLVERSAAMGERLRERLRSVEAHPHVGEVRGRGLLIGIELVADKATREPFPKSAAMANQVVTKGLQEGAFFYPGGTDPARDIITLGPPFTISETEIDDLVSILESSITAATAAFSG